MPTERVERDRALLQQIQLWASVAEGNPRKAQDQISRILNAALELGRERAVNDDRRKVLLDKLTQCSVSGEGVVALDKKRANRLFLNDEFDVEEFAKRFIW